MKEKILTYAGPRKLDGARSASNAFVIAPPNSRTPHGTFPLQALAERLARQWFAIQRQAQQIALSADGTKGQARVQHLSGTGKRAYLQPA